MAKQKKYLGDPTLPSIQLLVKLGSAVVHAEELLSPGGHEFDKAAFEGLVNDPEVRMWINAMTKLAMLPVKRAATPKQMSMAEILAEARKQRK